jgi:3-oxoacyl-(acyl-carrier-protein) synthase
VPLRAQRLDISHAMTNSFGFGGTNASLIFARP